MEPLDTITFVCYTIVAGVITAYFTTIVCLWLISPNPPKEW